MTDITMRFEVGDPICGTVDVYRNMLEAIKRATQHQAEHGVPFGVDPVSVFDRMAHLGQPQKWSSEGRCIERRRSQ